MDIGKGLSQSFDILKNNIGLLIGATLVAGLLSSITFGILAGPLIGGLLILCKKLVRGENAEFGEIFAHFDKFLPSFLLFLCLGVLYGAIIIINIILAFIPILGAIISTLIMVAFYVALPIILMTLTIALYAIMEKDMDTINALKYAVDVLKGNILMNWVYGLVFYLVSVIGVVACLVGVLFTAPILYLGMAIADQELGGANAAPASTINPSV